MTILKEPGVIYVIKFTSCLVCEVSASSKSDKKLGSCKTNLRTGSIWQQQGHSKVTIRSQQGHSREVNDQN